MAAAKPPRTRVIRKRYTYTRQRAKRSRPKTPAPKEGWLIAELSTLTGVSVRTLRSYVAKDLLRPIEFRGTVTRYPRRELLRLLKMLELKSQCRGRVVLAKLMRQVDAISDPALEAWAARQRLSPELGRALGIVAKATAPVAPGAVASGVLERVASETWRRIPLLPGLELMLSSDASLAVRGVAQRLYADVVGLPR
jgi:hypothetical protein